MNYQKLIESHSSISFIICVVGCENPKPCQTELTVLEYGEYDGDPITKVLLQPLTGTVSSTIQTKYRWNTLSIGKSLNIKHPVGRTHQLRVHCSAIGHPIVGDYTYSLRTDNAPYRMMLHCLLLAHPTREWTHPRHSPRSLCSHPRLQMGTTKMCECSGGPTEEYFDKTTNWNPRRTKASAQEEQPSGEWGATGTVSAVVMWMESGLRNPFCFTSTTLKLHCSVPSSRVLFSSNGSG